MTNTLNSAQEKRQLEHQAAKLFMRCYERASGLEIRHIQHNQPSKPDVSCSLNGEPLDLEIAHLYGSEQEAMQILNRELSTKTRDALREQEQLSDVNHRLLTALNRILKNKATKSYQSPRVWLIIRNAHPAWHAKDIERLRDHIHVSKPHPFEQIWVVADIDAQSGLVKLFP
jgi:hypothetical protein